MALALLISEKNYQKYHTKKKYFMSLDASVTARLFLHLEKVVIVLSRQCTASDIVMGSFKKVLGIS